MAFEACVVGENFARGEQERGSAEEAILGVVCEQYGREADAVTAEAALDGCGFFGVHFKVAASGCEPADFGAHGVGEGGVSAAEAHHYCVGVFSSQAEEPLFEGG